MKKNKNLYEGMYIISAQLSEGARSKALERITSSIEKKEGQLHKIHDLGRKKLVYEIGHHRDGYYFLIYFDLDASAMDEIIGEYHLNEDLVRFMITKTESIRETLEFKKLAKV